MITKLSSFISDFRDDESGAVTVDFVVLVATTVLLGLAVVSSFDDEVLDVANDISNTIGNQKVR